MRDTQQIKAIITRLEEIFLRALDTLKKNGVMMAAAHDDKDILALTSLSKEQLEKNFEDGIKATFLTMRQRNHETDYLIGALEKIYPLLLLSTEKNRSVQNQIFQFETAFLEEYFQLCCALPDAPALQKCVLKYKLVLCYRDQRDSKSSGDASKENALYLQNLNCVFDICLTQWEETGEWLKMASVLSNHYISRNSPADLGKAELILQKIEKSQVQNLEIKAILKSYYWRMARLKTGDQKQVSPPQPPLSARIYTVLEEMEVCIRQCNDQLPGYSADLKSALAHKGVVAGLLKRSPIPFDQIRNKLVHTAELTEKYLSNFLRIMLKKQLLDVALECNAQIFSADQSKEEMILLTHIANLYTDAIECTEGISPKEAYFFKKELLSYILLLDKACQYDTEPLCHITAIRKTCAAYFYIYIYHEPNSHFLDRILFLSLQAFRISTLYPRHLEIKKIADFIAKLKQSVKKILATPKEQRKLICEEQVQNLSRPIDGAPIEITPPDLKTESGDEQKTNPEEIKEAIVLQKKVLAEIKESEEKRLGQLEEQKKHIESLQQEISDLRKKQQEEEKKQDFLSKELQQEKENEVNLEKEWLELTRGPASSAKTDIQLAKQEIVFLRMKKMEIEEKITFAQKQQSEEEKGQLLESELKEIQNHFFYLTAEMPRLTHKKEIHEKNIYPLNEEKGKLLRGLRKAKKQKKIRQNQEMEMQNFPRKLRKAKKKYEDQHNQLTTLKRDFFTLAMLYNPQPFYILYPCCCNIFSPPPLAELADCYTAPYPCFFSYPSPSDEPIPLQNFPDVSYYQK